MTATLYWPRKEILDDTFEFPEAQLLMMDMKKSLRRK